MGMIKDNNKSKYATKIKCSETYSWLRITPRSHWKIAPWGEILYCAEGLKFAETDEPLEMGVYPAIRARHLEIWK